MFGSEKKKGLELGTSQSDIIKCINHAVCELTVVFWEFRVSFVFILRYLVSLEVQARFCCCCCLFLIFFFIENESYTVYSLVSS